MRGTRLSAAVSTASTPPGAGHDLELVVAALVGGRKRGVGVRHLEGHRAGAARLDRVEGLASASASKPAGRLQRDVAGPSLVAVVPQIDPQRAGLSDGERREREHEVVELGVSDVTHPRAEVRDLGERLERAAHCRHHADQRGAVTPPPRGDQRRGDPHPSRLGARGRAQPQRGGAVVARPQPAERHGPLAAPAVRQVEAHASLAELPGAARPDRQADLAARGDLEVRRSDLELGAQRQAARRPARARPRASPRDRCCRRCRARASRSG